MTLRRMDRRIALAVIVIAAVTLPRTVFAQVDEEALFGGASVESSDSLIRDLEETDLIIEELLLTNAEGVRIGGSFRFASTASWLWDAAEDVPRGLTAGPVQDSLGVDLQARVTLDARPSATTRFFGELWLSYPFTATANAGAGFIHVDELFSDFLLGDRLFVRAGKHTLNWGVGYFYSPADLLNLSKIDPANPDADLEGPISIRFNLPVGINNLYAYAIIPEGARYASDVAVAAAYEHVVGGAELTLGGYYRNGQSPAAMATVTRTVRDVGLFAEAMVRYGSDRVFVEALPAPATTPLAPTALRTVTYADRPFASATLGASYRWTAESGNTSANLIGQYYFNGEGYGDPDLINRTVTPAIVPLLARGELAARDLANPGLHYLGASAALNLPRDVSLRVLTLANMSDWSGTVRPTVTLKLGDSLGFSVGVPYTWGGRGDQYTPAGSRVGVTIEVSAGALRF